MPLSNVQQKVLQLATRKEWDSILERIPGSSDTEDTYFQQLTLLERTVVQTRSLPLLQAIFNEKYAHALRIATFHNHEAVALELLKIKGLPVNTFSASQQQRTPLHFACQHGNSRVVRCLLECGAYPNILDTNAVTPRHLAFAGRTEEHFEVVKCLKAYGVKSMADKAGRSCRDYMLAEPTIFRDFLDVNFEAVKNESRGMAELDNPSFQWVKEKRLGLFVVPVVSLFDQAIKESFLEILHAANISTLTLKELITIERRTDLSFTVCITQAYSIIQNFDASLGENDIIIFSVLNIESKDECERLRDIISISFLKCFFQSNYPEVGFFVEVLSKQDLAQGRTGLERPDTFNVKLKCQGLEKSAEVRLLLSKHEISFKECPDADACVFSLSGPSALELNSKTKVHDSVELNVWLQSECHIRS